MEFMFQRNVSIAVLLTTVWPIKHAFEMEFVYEFGTDTASQWHSFQRDPFHNCAGKNAGSIEWARLQDLIWTTVRNESLVYGASIRDFIFHEDVQDLVTDQLQHPYNFVPDCFLGWVATLLVKAGITWHMEASVYFSYEQVLKGYLADLTFWEFFGSSWLLSALLCQVCVFHRTTNEMDFSGPELLQDMHILSLLDIGHLRLKASPIFSATAAAVLGKGARAYTVSGESRLLTYTVYVWGEAFLKWLPAYIKRFHSLGVYNLMVYGDAAAYQVCSAIQGAVCLQLETKNALHRYTVPLALMNLGVDVFVLDFDIYPFQDPTPVLISEMESYSVTPEFLIAGSFGDACICNALAFYRNTPSLRDFIRGLLVWLYEHPFPGHAITQRALSAFLGEAPMQKTESTRPFVVKAERLAPWLPDRASPGIAWAVLDPGVQFSSSANLETSGWAGDAEEIVIYHFFYGAWLDAEVAMTIDVKDREMFDIFYNTSCGTEPQACEERRNQRIQKHLVANRRGDVRNHTERACFSLPITDLEIEPKIDLRLSYVMPCGSLFSCNVLEDASGKNVLQSASSASPPPSPPSSSLSSSSSSSSSVLML
ncbi:unnamed protein product [Symbiodinium sp. CCMP2592]|nr:unnamed protein product [Symbiodinium sp. CCMP2592]